ncbi:tetratricopeptide repeat protein [Caminibacter mediatlanticus]|uniref:tetratricopeptide repeat protein n=1 Tax=Caminibacter mediatlanticus TaxID=291048 RepID=UPI001FD1BB64|nr:hypothetical protein [Caminibacter mediatlanticus]
MENEELKIKQIYQYTNILITLFFLLFIIGCSAKKPQIGKKAFDKEDEYIMKALFFESNGDYNKSIPIYEFLYKKTNKRIYLDKKIEDLFYSKKYNDVIKEVEDLCKKKLCDDKILRYEVFAYLNLGKLNEAKELLLRKLNKKDEFFYSVMSYILISEGKESLALEYIKSLYALNPNKNNLLKLSDFLIKLKKYNEALAYLRTHLKMYGCDYDICIRLADVYKSLYDYDNLANIYEKLGVYDIKFYILAFNIYIQNKEFKKAERLIKTAKLGDEYYLFLYLAKKDYKKAAYKSLELYDKTGKLNYLIKYCEYLYASHPTKEELRDIIDRLKFVVNIKKDAYLYNFLGYILIDNNINVKEGIKYVQKALNLDPTNEEYIDSLAWGYYKLKKCKEAKELIDYVKLKDKTILRHKKLINQCIKENNDFRQNNKSNKNRLRKKKK